MPKLLLYKNKNKLASPFPRDSRALCRRRAKCIPPRSASQRKQKQKPFVCAVSPITHAPFELPLRYSSLKGTCLKHKSETRIHLPLTLLALKHRTGCAFRNGLFSFQMAPISKDGISPDDHSAIQTPCTSYSTSYHAYTYVHCCCVCNNRVSKQTYFERIRAPNTT